MNANLTLKQNFERTRHAMPPVKPQPAPVMQDSPHLFKWQASNMVVELTLIDGGKLVGTIKGVYRFAVDIEGPGTTVVFKHAIMSVAATSKPMFLFCT